MAASAVMAGHGAPCSDTQVVGHLLVHEVRFTGPVGGQQCELPEGQHGQVEHVFENRSIYPHTFNTTATVTPGALAVVGPPSPPPVTVPSARRGPLRATPGKGTASQKVEHVAGLGIGLPHTATAAFTTTVTAPWGACPLSPTQPAVSITLTP
jgi:hypothetical protein